MKLGFSRTDITPTEPVGLAGYGNSAARLSQNVLSPLYTTCIALTDDREQTVLLVQNDILLIIASVSDPIRRAIAEETGIPFENIILHSTHNHSSPDLGCPQIEANGRYRQWLSRCIRENALKALADRKTVTSAETAKNRTKGLNFVRHYVLEDGSYRGDNFGEFNPSPYQGHTTEADPEMRLVKFHRAGGTDVLLCNWQSHPHRTGGTKKYDVSSDIIGVLRDEMEAALDCSFLYFTGGAGNINPISYMPEENITKDYLEQGRALARYALDAENRYEPLALDNIRICTQSVWEPLNRPDKEMLEAACKIRDYWLETNDSIASKKYAHTFGINSQHAALQFIRRINMKEDGFYYPFTALSLGDLAFVAVPYEMFDTHAKYVRDCSPFRQTIVASCCNDYLNYVPSAYAFLHGCYEADSSRVKPGAGERFAYTMVRMLRSLK